MIAIVISGRELVIRKMARQNRMQGNGIVFRLLVVLAFSISLFTSFQARSSSVLKANDEPVLPVMSNVINCDVGSSVFSSEIGCQKADADCQMTICQIQYFRIQDAGLPIFALSLQKQFQSNKILLSGIGAPVLAKPPRPYFSSWTERLSRDRSIERWRVNSRLSVQVVPAPAGMRFSSNSQ